MSFFRLDRPIAPQLIQILYGIALAVIALILVAGIVRGVWLMTSPPLPGNAPPMAATAPGPAAAGPSQQRPQLMPRRVFHRGPMMDRFGRGPGFARRLPPVAQGGFLILLAVIRALVAWLVVRILAEMGLAILSLRSRPV